jgi:hypothetical protein
MAVHPAHELLIHILDPNRSVEGNYRAYTVSTDDGRVVTGLLAAESKTAIELVDAEGKRVAIQRDDVDLFQPSPNSLMPVGFEKQIKPEGFAPGEGLRGEVEAGSHVPERAGDRRDGGVWVHGRTLAGPWMAGRVEVLQARRLSLLNGNFAVHVPGIEPQS